MFFSRDWQTLEGEISQAARQFAAAYQNRPFNNNNGMDSIGAFSLFYFIKSLKPTYIVESGIWRGFSTWAIDQAAPEANLFCLDPVLALADVIDREKFLPIFRLPKAHYSHEDFSCANLPQVEDQETSVVIFDDHQNKLRRLQLARERGFRHIIFDDNTPFAYTHLTLEQLIANGYAGELEKSIDTYETLPPLWDVRSNNIDVPGLNFAELEDLKPIFNEPAPFSYSWITYVRLR